MAEWRETGDQLDRTATQVRLLGRNIIHAVADEWNDPEKGRRFRTVCDRVLGRGAFRTTRPADCPTCLCRCRCSTAVVQGGESRG